MLVRVPLVAAVLVCTSALPADAADQPLPFDYKIERYRAKDSDVMVFALKLEQPFLAEEFEKSNYLRLAPLDDKAYLIYPRETRFEQKHAEFHGRLRGEGEARVKLAYEIVSENLDGSRKVDVREAELTIAIPAEPTGIPRIHQQWAREQNAHFANLLSFCPDESFFEYVLLQSAERYGIERPPLPETSSPAQETETDLYHIFGGGLAVQQSLQRQTLSDGPLVGDLDVHVSQLSPPVVRSPDYKSLLAEKTKAGIQPRTHDLAKYVPADHYFLHFHSIRTANELAELTVEWGENLLRLFTVQARNHHLFEKHDRQLCIERDALGNLFGDGVVAEFAVTGSDFFIAEGTDVTVLFRLSKADLFDQAAAAWLERAKDRHPMLNVREFNYRGHKVAARYLNDRTISSFVVRKDDVAIFSNSHVAIRKVIDTMIGLSPSLHDATDYQYISTVLPPSDDPASAYLYASDAFLRRLVSPRFKIAEKRRRQSFNNLVMLNNASLFYRLEYGRSPESLNDLIQGRFVNPNKVVDPTGGAFAFDTEADTCTSSLYNRIKYLTPILELDVQNVSRREQQEYERYRERYEALYRQFFDPIAMRIAVGPTVKLETYVLPFANGSLYGRLRDWLDERPQPMETATIADTAVASLIAAPGRDRIAGFLTALPGVTDALRADPTLTDLSWLGDRVSLHYCDDDMIVEIDPTRFRQLPSLIPVSVQQQGMAAAAIAATNLPVYLSIDVEDEEKASRLLKLLSTRIILQKDRVLGQEASLDAYRVPEYKKHAIYVVSYQWYAVKVRLYLALVGGRLVAATEPATLRSVIDVAEREPANQPAAAHAMFRLNLRAMEKMQGDVQVYWAEKYREACHRNIMPIYNLIKLYDVPIGEVNELADAKYGVTYFCPGGGKYIYDAGGDQVFSTIYGNRQNARQGLSIDDEGSFARFFNSLDEVQASLRFMDGGLLGTIEIKRQE